MIKFEVVEAYKDKEINLPKRGTKYSAGYDIESAVDIVIPSLFQAMKTNIRESIPVSADIFKSVGYFESYNKQQYGMDTIKKIVKEYNLRTMVPTGLKVKMDDNVVLELHPRSSTGSNCLLQLANQTGIVDADYYNSEDTEGHIFIPLINLSPYDIQIRKGDKIAQGIFHEYLITDDDEAFGERTGGFGSTDKISEPYGIPVGESRKFGNDIYENHPTEGIIIRKY